MDSDVSAITLPSNLTNTAALEEENAKLTTTWISACVVFVIVVFTIATLHWYRERRIVQFRKKVKRLKERRASAQICRGVKAVTTAPIARNEFLSAYKQKIKDNSFTYELQAIRFRSESYECSVALQQCNLSKNYSTKYIPYDYNRVRLNCTNDDSTTDYINASYIYDTYTSTQPVYIATQGPLSFTVNDFWRMVWQEGVRCIVMLTDIFSYSRQECVKYWHDTYTLCGNIHVMVESSHQSLHYTIRNFRIAKIGHGEGRDVRHFLFHGWTTKALPDPGGLLNFRRRVNAYRSTLSAPTVVHCSTGSGRTGAYIALDKAMETLNRHGVVDVLNIIVALRRYRSFLVTDSTLLETIYKAFYLRLLSGQSVVPINVMNCAIRHSTNPVLADIGLEYEYKLFSELIPKLTVGECAAGHRLENRYKSRDIMIQPPERARPHLMTFDMTEHSDFINAVCVDGYKEKNEFIVGQWPVKSSIADFWRLVLDKEITSTAVLHCIQGNTKKYPVFWPTTLYSCERFGPVAVTLVDTGETPAYSVRILNVRKYLLNSAEATNLYKNSLTIRIVFFKRWPDDRETIDDADQLINLMNDINKYNSRQYTAQSHTFVMSRVGEKRVGVYCALSICLHQMENEDEVDVFNAVRTVKQNRPSLVNKTEYQFLHRVVSTMMMRILHNKSRAMAQLLSNSIRSDLSEQTSSTEHSLEAHADTYL